MSGPVLDLFAGPGGWSQACKALDLDEHGVEIEPTARLTRDAAGHVTVHDDVWTFAPTRAYDGLIASPPCQTFSMAGKGTGRKALDDVLTLIRDGVWESREQLRAEGERLGDDRTALVLTPLHYTYALAPLWTVWEQVPTVLPVWEACAEELRAIGYSVWTGLLQAEQYGVPQTRKRAVLIAKWYGEATKPEPTHSRYYARDPERVDEGVLPWVSMAEALGWGMNVRPSYTVTGGGADTGGAEPFAKSAREAMHTVMRSNYGTGGDPRDRGERRGDQPAATVTSKPGKWQTGAVVAAGITGEGRPRDVEHPAPTVTTKGTAYLLDDADDYRGGNAADRQVHTELGEQHTYRANVADDKPWTRKRPATTLAGRGLVPDPGANANRFNGSTKSRNDGVRVTPAEAGVLQTFPADYPWQGSKTRQYQQVGNAVPPLLAEAVLREALRESTPQVTRPVQEVLL